MNKNLIPPFEGTFRENETARYRVLTENTTVGIAQVNLDFSIVFANPAMRAWMDVETDDQLRERTFLEYFTPESVKRVREQIKQRAQGVSSVYEVDFISRRGRHFTLVISGSPVMGSGGALEGLIATFVDVTDYKKAVLLLEKTVESMPDGVMVVHHDGRILAYNQRFLNLWEIPPEMMEGSTQDSLVAHMKSRLLNPGQFISYCEGGLISAGDDLEENQFQLRSGRTIEVCRRREQFLDNTSARVMCVRDITDRLKMEARLKHADRMATIGTMAAGVAHEINNPLTHLIGGLELLAERLDGAKNISGKEIGEIQGRLHVLLNSSIRISNIVKDLKTFSRPDVEQTEPVDLRAVIESTVSLLSLELSRKATLSLVFGKTPAVLANEGRLGQVILNMIINAIQAVRTENPRQNQISVVTGVNAMGFVFVEIRDNGIGMTPDVQARVFQPFFTTKGNGVGTGLGLSICYNIIKSFKGEIEVESTPDTGTVFRFTLPPATEGVAEALPHAVGTAPKRGRILVVDDERDICDLIQGAISSEHEVTSCYSGAEALGLLLPDPLSFDLIICDLTMPAINGIDIFEKVRAQSPGMESRFLFVTGGALTKDAEDLLRRRAHQVLTKPFNLRDLRDAVTARIK